MIDRVLFEMQTDEDDPRFRHVRIRYPLDDVGAVVATGPAAVGQLRIFCQQVLDGLALVGRPVPLQPDEEKALRRLRAGVERGYGDVIAMRGWLLALTRFPSPTTAETVFQLTARTWPRERVVEPVDWLHLVTMSACLGAVDMPVSAADAPPVGEAVVHRWTAMRAGT